MLKYLMYSIMYILCNYSSTVMLIKFNVVKCCQKLELVVEWLELLCG